MDSGPGPEQTTERRLKCWIDGFLELTEGIPSPAIFRKWAAICAVSGAMERRIWIRTAEGQLFGNVYVLLVAPPGIGKTEAIRRVHTLWASTGLFHVAKSSVTKASLVDDLASRSRVVTIDGAPERYHSILVASNEFGTLMPEYEMSFVSLMNQLYDCDKLYDESRRSRPEQPKIENMHMTMIGGTQPSFLAHVFPEQAWGQGFASRFLMIFSGEVMRVSLFTKRPKKQEMQTDLVADLKVIGKQIGQMDFSESAIETIESWHTTSAATGPKHSKLQHYCTRRTVHVLKLSMIYAVSRGSMTIELPDFKKALETLAEAEEEMPEIFKYMVMGPHKDIVNEAWEYVFREYMRTKKPVGEQKLTSFLITKVPVNQIRFIVDNMVTGGWLKEDSVKVGGYRFFKPESREQHNESI